MRIALCFAILFSLLIGPPAFAGTWPDRPVHLIVPYPPGGNVDLTARIVADRMQEHYGQPFVVENRPGAGGMIAGAYVAKADNDGYTLFVAPNGPVLFSPLIFGRDTYNWREDFAPIGSITFTSLVLQVNSKLGVNNVDELFALAKQDPDALNMASPGVGTQNHMVSELLQRSVGAEWSTIQYSGNAPATTDLLGGHVDFNFDQLTVAKQYLESEQLQRLAVTSANRLPALPDVPTLVELGYEDAVAETFTGLFAPAGTPQDILNDLSSSLTEMLGNDDVIARFDTMGAEARAMRRDDFNAYLASNYEKWSRVIEEANIKQ
ncbi:MAG TPA: twin-arginine translocation pathway signal [Pseudomonas sp.]|nr:twin-arginine translocation pathway signal [Pseudomonas sp.]HCA25826.1 twin-arginine translocation pathway signal [Pseudomonas sp.]